MANHEESILYQTGATRDSSNDKLDFEGFLSPIVLERFAQYMHKCRLRNIPAGETIRASDNWQLGIDRNDYMKSLLRHVIEVWKIHRNTDNFVDKEYLLDELSAILFNVQGYMFELLREKETTLTFTGGFCSKCLSFMINEKCKCNL